MRGLRPAPVRRRATPGWPPVSAEALGLPAGLRAAAERPPPDDPSTTDRSTGRRAVVIGAGFGGLALAIRLQAAGIATTIVEKRDRAGGRAYVFQDAGFTFDAGPTVITDPSAIAELFTLVRRRMGEYVDLQSVSPFYRLIWDNGSTFDYVADQEGLERQIAARNPADVEGYRRFHAYAEAVLEEGYVKLGAVPFLRIGQMAGAAPALAKLQAWRSVYGLVARFIQNEELRQAFSFHSLLVGGNPFATPSIYALIHALERRWGVWYPRGGTGALVDGMVRLFEDLGGTVHLNAEAERIEMDGPRVAGIVLRDGRRLAADAVASNADVVHTYRELLGHVGRGRRKGASLAKKRHSMSLFLVYFGLRRHRPELQQHTVLFGPRYRGLIDEIFRGPNLPRDFSLYLHSPCSTDPSLAPPGAGAYYALAPVPHLGSAAIDWKREAPLLRDRILDRLEERLIPGLREDLVTVRTFSPLDFRDTLNAHQGSAFSLEPTLMQSAWFRPHNRDDKIPNLYIVGAGTHPGAGIPGVVGSAKATAGLMLADLAVVAETARR